MRGGGDMVRRAVHFPFFALIVCLIALAICYYGAGVTSANDGLNMIGFSAASSGMGGADLVARGDAAQLNNNPAALSLIRKVDAELDLAAILTNLHHQDQFGNNGKGQNNPFLLANGGYARRLTSHLTVGVGIFSRSEERRVGKECRL